MKPRFVGVLLKLYPASVRDRYGEEIAGLLTVSPQPLRDTADVIRAALGHRAQRALMGYRRMVLRAWVLLPIEILALLAERPDLFLFGLVIVSIVVLWRWPRRKRTAARQLD